MYLYHIYMGYAVSSHRLHWITHFPNRPVESERLDRHTMSPLGHPRTISVASKQE